MTSSNIKWGTHYTPWGNWKRDKVKPEAPTRLWTTMVKETPLPAIVQWLWNFLETYNKYKKHIKEG